MYTRVTKNTQLFSPVWVGQVSKGGTAYLMDFCYIMKCLCGYG